MALRNVVVEGDPVLRKRAREVEKIGKKERMIFDDMVETMKVSNGCGLAAPQVGLLKRMIVLEVPDPESELESSTDIEVEVEANSPEQEVQKEVKLVTYKLANPEVISMSGSQIDEEGCLSLPGLTGKVERPQTIHIKALDYNGDTVEIYGNGFLAVVLSHEIDHLNGVLFTDKATEIESIEDIDS